MVGLVLNDLDTQHRSLDKGYDLELTKSQRMNALINSTAFTENQLICTRFACIIQVLKVKGKIKCVSN